MIQIIMATFEDGVLKPAEPLDLLPHSRVRVAVESLDDAAESQRRQHGVGGVAGGGSGRAPGIFARMSAGSVERSAEGYLQFCRSRAAGPLARIPVNELLICSTVLVGATRGAEPGSPCNRVLSGREEAGARRGRGGGSIQSC